MADNTTMGDLTMGEVVASTPKYNRISTIQPSGNLVQGKDTTMADGTSLRDATMGDFTSSTPKARITAKNEPATGAHDPRNDISRMEAIAATLHPRPFPVIPCSSTVEATPPEGPRLAIFDYYGSEMVDFIVGPQGRKISVHLNMLLVNPDCTRFRETLQHQKNSKGTKKLRLNDHPDAVGLMVQFLYTGKVPFVPRRLLQKHTCAAATTPTADDAERRSQTVRHWHERVQPHLQNVEKIPVFGMSTLRVEAEFLQSKLVHLMVFADKYDMAWLFHDALASYCRGEALFQRDCPLERHVELAYQCAKFRLFPMLIAEYGRFCAAKRGTEIDTMFHGYLPEFVADVKVKKAEGKPIPGIIDRFLRMQI
ncbi:hypothetical protein CcaCcLH18_09549 [Colletotrichum camelliae]|nr:hypothetical protein CcaCcLH18_09549 [Colletotrichum camelliae]